jgi:chromate transporter
MRLLTILRHFSFIGATIIGQGKQLYLQDRFVRRLNWMTNEEFTDGLALCSIVPGPNITNMAAYTGWLLGGWPGALLAWLGMLVPGFLIILAVAVVARAGAYPPVLRGALAGVAATSVCMMLTVIVRAAPPACRRVRGGWLVALGTFLLAGPSGVGVLPTVLIFGIVSVLLNRPRHSARPGGSQMASDVIPQGREVGE